jgi:hypothetical protein
MMPGKEFIGRVEEPYGQEFDLKDACATFTISTQQGVKRMIKSIAKEPDYTTGDIWIIQGPGVLIMPLSDQGPMYKAYLQTIGSIVVPDLTGVNLGPSH